MHLWKHVCALLLMPSVSLAGSIHLTWNPPEDGTPTGYSMERKRGVNDTWGALPWGTNAAVDTTYTDTFDATPALPVCYRVRAISPLGKSAPSNEFCFETLGNPPVGLTGTFTGTFTGTVSFTPTKQP